MENDPKETDRDVDREIYVCSFERLIRMQCRSLGCFTIFFVFAVLLVVIAIDGITKKLTVSPEQVFDAVQEVQEDVDEIKEEVVE